MTTLVAPICGPILGGWISDNMSWRWIFFINVPVGIVCTAICYRGLITRETPTFKRSIDTVGFLFLLVWVSALQVMLDRGQDLDWFHSPFVVVLGAVSSISFVSWLIWELTDANPIVDLALFKSRNFAVGTLVFCLVYAVFFGGNVLQPLWLQTRLGYIATWAGLVAAPSGVVAVLLTPLFARFSARVDARVTGTLALLAFALSFLMRGAWTPDVSFSVLVLPMLVQGVAMSTFFVSMITIQLKDVPAQLTPQASGLSNFARITAGGFAASLTTAFWDRSAPVCTSRTSPISRRARIPEWQRALSAPYGIPARARSKRALGALNAQVVNQASTVAALDIFWLFGVLSVVMVPLIWFTRRSLSDGFPALGGLQRARITESARRTFSAAPGWRRGSFFFF